MRLLAHGGTSFSERHRLGSWPSIPREVLESTYGLPGESMIYGLGVLDDCQPFLVIRVRQVTEIGRSYAYSLLLDPGRDVWVRFGWNAADLLRAILEDEVGELLLLRPESLTAEDLKQHLDRLLPQRTPLAPERHGPPTQSTELFHHWVGAAFASDPIVLSPGTLGFAERPTHQQLIDQLYQFPQACFRVGAGWLVGASGEHAAALGAHLVIDDQLNGESSPASDNAERGRQATDAWLTILQRDEFKGALLDLEGVPFCEWDVAQGLIGEALFSRLRLLAELLNGDRVPDQLQTLEDQFRDSPFLATEIRRAAHSLVLSKTDSLSPMETAVALRNFYEQGLEIPPDGMRRLDSETVIRMVLDRELKKLTTSRTLPLPPETQATIFVRLLGATPDYSDIPQLLIKASAFMMKHFQGTRLTGWLTELTEAVETRTNLTNGSLRLWETFPNDHILWEDLTEILKKVVWDRAQTGHPGWELEYLQFGKDPGGALLARGGIDHTKTSQLIGSYLSEVQNQTALAPLAKDWLAGLADSSLRLRVSIADKIAIAETRISESWLPFLRLWAAYDDSPDSGDLNSGLVNKRTSQEELNRLGHELFQMLRSYPPRTKVPDIPRIEKLLGNVPPNFFSELAACKRQLGTATFARWIERLREVGQVELAASETLCFCEESKERLPENWLFRGFSEEKLAVLVDFLIFGGFATDDVPYRSRCEEILSTQYHWPRLRDTVAKVCKSGLTDREKLESFVRRYGGHETALVRLFACFSASLKHDIVTELALRDTEDFIKHAREIIEETERGKRLNNYRYAVLRYVRTCDLESKKKLTRWSLYTKSGLDHWIDGLLEAAKEEVDEDPLGENAEEKEVPLYSTAQVSAAATPIAGKPRDPQDADDRESRAQLLTKTRPGLRQRIGSLLGSVFSAEPPPESNREESGSTASHVKKDDS